MNWVDWLGNPVGVSTGVTVLDLPDGEIDQIIRGEKLGDPAILRFRDPSCFRAGEIHKYSDQWGQIAWMVLCLQYTAFWLEDIPVYLPFNWSDGV